MITNETLETIKKRRSIRKFKEDQIKKEELDAILEAAIYAPTGHNDQPWHFTVIQNKNLLNTISALTNEAMRKSEVKWIAKLGEKNRHIFFNAPTVVIVSGRKNGYSPLTDCSAAIQNMLLAAESLNIGSLWNGLVELFFKMDQVKELNIPEGFEPYYAVALGYKDCEQPKTPERNKDVYSYIKHQSVHFE